MRYKTLFIWLFLGGCSLTYAQEYQHFKGTVINSTTKSPIEGANVVGNGFYAVTSSKGTFTLKNVPHGRYEFRISHVGYVAKILEIVIGPAMKKATISLDESNTSLDEVEISGKSKTRIAQESPTVTVGVNAEFLANNRENTLMQTLRKIPGVTTINIGSGQSKPIIRGLGFNRVAVVQNGIKHEAQQWGSDHGLEIDQFGLENITIIKGPASLLYGSDAIGGVVDIEAPMMPVANSFTGEASVLGESNNNLGGVSVGAQARADKWFYRGRLTYKNYGDYKVPAERISYENYIFELHENNLRNSAGREANASFSLGFVNDKFNTETFLSNVNTKNGFFANAHGLEVRTSSIDYDASNRDIDLPYQKVNHFKIINLTNIELGKHALQINLGYQNNHRQEHTEPTAHGYMPKPSITLEREFTKNTFSITVKDAFKPHQKHEVVAGVNMEFQDNKIGGWGFLIPDYNRLTLGAFAYDQFQLKSNFHLLAGLRYDYGRVQSKAYYDWFRSVVDNPDGTSSNVYLQRAQDKTLHFGNFSGSVGLSYIHKRTAYKMSIGKSFRIPLANELASDGVFYHMYRYEKGNLDLDPEESYQLDVEIDHTAKYMTIGFSPFLNFFENYIYLNPTSDYVETQQIYAYTQAQVLRFGGEFSIGTSAVKNLQLDATAEYVYSRQTSGPKKNFTLPFSPPFSALFSASYKFKDFLFVNKPQFIADVRITAAQDEIVPPEEITAGSQVLNLSLLAEMDLFKQTEPLEIRLKFNNILNTKYFNHTSFYRLIDVPEPGRNIAISLTLPFN